MMRITRIYALGSMILRSVEGATPPLPHPESPNRGAFVVARSEGFGGLWLGVLGDVTGCFERSRSRLLPAHDRHFGVNLMPNAGIFRVLPW
jgi:hypothetical protein